MRVLVWVISTFLLLVLHVGLLSVWGLSEANPILIFLSLALLASRIQGSLTVAIAGGLMLDFLSGTKDGTMTLTLLGTWWVMHVIYEGFVKRVPDTLTFVLSVVGSTWGFAVILFLVNWMYSWFGISQPVVGGNFFTHYILWATLFNLVISYPVWKYISVVEYYAEKLASKK